MHILWLFLLLVGCGAAPQTSYLTMDHNLGAMNFYYGNLHSHTAYSDGTGSPSDMLQWARDKIGYDFYAITDHAELLTESNWNDIGAKVQDFTEDGKFVAIRGFEYTNYFLGHINIFNTSTYKSFFNYPRLRGIYRWIEDQPNALVELNHAGNPLGAFRKITIPESISDKVFGMETGNGYNRNSSNLFIPYYNRALRSGYHLAPLYNMDNHTKDEIGCRTVVIAEKLTPLDIAAALKARRVYSADSPYAKVAFKCNGEWMGSKIKARENKIHCTVTASNNKPITQIHIISEDVENNQLYNFYDETYNASIDLDIIIASNTYFYVKVFSKDPLQAFSPQELMSITAPIWVEKYDL